MTNCGIEKLNYKIIWLTKWQINKNKSFGHYPVITALDVPPRARPALAASVASVSVCFSSLCLLWHQFWSALAASEWRLTEQTADRAYKRVTVREINQILPHHQHCLLDEDVVENLPARPPPGSNFPNPMQIVQKYLATQNIEMQRSHLLQWPSSSWNHFQHE